MSRMQWRSIFLSSLLLLTELTVTNSLPQCPASNGSQLWWNGEKCEKCSPCPPGQGVKTKCTITQDTVCGDCLSGHQYSDKSSTTDPCTPCNPDDPNSLCGYPYVYVAQKCTPTTKPICNDCIVGHYFYEEGFSCVECSPPCKLGEYEEKSCATEHNRICKPDLNTTMPGDTIILTDTPVPEVTYPLPPKTTTMATSTTLVPATRKEGGLLTFLPSPWNWIVICFCLVVLVGILCSVWRCYKRRQVKRDQFHVEEIVPLQDVPATAADQVPSIPDRPPTGPASPASAAPSISCVNLDSPFLHLPVAWRQDIAFKLVSGDGYDPWKLLAEDLGIGKSKVSYWDSRTCNPAEELFKIYEKMEGSTIWHFISLLRKRQGSSLLANEIERGIVQGLSSPIQLYPQGQLSSPPESNGEETGEMNRVRVSEVHETEV